MTTIEATKQYLQELRDENTRLKECVRSLTEQNAALIWERDGHGKSNVPDIFVQNAALVGENMVLKSEYMRGYESAKHEWREKLHAEEDLNARYRAALLKIANHDGPAYDTTREALGENNG